MNRGLVMVAAAFLAVWALLGYLAWHRDRLPDIFSPATAPVPPDELWTLSPG